MEPGHEDREYDALAATDAPVATASMEPGHEDREYTSSPTIPDEPRLASMEPGHEDREYTPSSAAASPIGRPQWSPVMKTENTRTGRRTPHHPARLNGARS